MRWNHYLAVALLLLAGLLAVMVLSRRESLTDRAHAVCEACGLAVAETDRLIDIMRTAEGDRAALLGVYYSTFGDDTNPEPCRPCAESILDAAGR